MFERIKNKVFKLVGGNRKGIYFQKVGRISMNFALKLTKKEFRIVYKFVK